ncbi:ArnT family glycosyltransferase [Litorimonas sp. RW-G-Af-16]|uniref:ArnT family glycosyltransferase n=1 Tax=Litorimonas sp. RW-G-Af-16 TaxID=3241168 RepID=UPI003AAEBA57
MTYRGKTLALIAGLLVLRLIALRLSPNQLHGDEAQYWVWAQELDFGYFSKPPMVAWVIASTTAIFGDTEWVVRLASPIIHSLTAWILFLTGRTLVDDRAGFWAAAIYLLMPAVWLSSMIISTDVALLFFWALGVNAWVNLRIKPSWGRAVQLGIALGLGFMSKYAMMFFGPAFALAIMFDPATRKALLHWRGLAGLLIMAAIITPNILWNIDHDFATVSHTAENANLKQDMFHPMELITFWIDQFGVFGPISLALLLGALAAAFKRQISPMVFWLAALCITPLIAISIEALISRANANWAVTAYGVAPVILAVWLVGRARARAWMKWGLIGHTALALILLPIVLMPAWTDALGLANSVKRLRGWPETVNAIAARYEAGHNGQSFQSIAMDNRLVFYDTEYYGLRDMAPLTFWRLTSEAKHHAEMTHPLTASAAKDAPVLLINHYENYVSFFEQDFAKLEALEAIKIDLGGGKTRHLNVWAAYGYTPTTDPYRGQ